MAQNNFGKTLNATFANALLQHGLDTRPKKPTPEAYWRAVLANQGSISKPGRRSVGEKMEDATVNMLGRLGMQQREAQRLGKKLYSAVNDLTPVGNVTGADEGQRAFRRGLTRGDLGQAALGAGMFGLSVLPGSKGAKKVTENFLGRLLRDESGAIRAYHGSPHDFDRFDMSKIGSGEGAQAYGHGLYFAENKKVAEEYQKALSRGAPGSSSGPARSMVVDGREISRQNTTDYAAADLAHLARGNEADIIKDYGSLEAWARADVAARGLDARKVLPKFRDFMGRDVGERWHNGRLYEVNINAEPEDFLDWDAPLTEQPSKVRDALGYFAEERQRALDAVPEIGADMSYADFERKYGTQFERAAKLRLDPNWTGRTVYGAVDGMPLPRDTQYAGLGARRAPTVMQDLGIPGIRYLDQGSRNALGNLTSNYVVFDDSLIDILNKY